MKTVLNSPPKLGPPYPYLFEGEGKGQAAGGLPSVADRRGGTPYRLGLTDPGRRDPFSHYLLLYFSRVEPLSLVIIPPERRPWI